MSLGCDQLTDDQLFQLTQEICAEWVSRDPLVRAAAQAEIVTAAQKLSVLHEALKNAVHSARQEFWKRIRDECDAYVKQGVGSGEIQLFAPQEEGVLIANAVIKAKEALARAVVSDAERSVAGGFPEYARLELVSVVIERVTKQMYCSPSGGAIARQIWDRAQGLRARESAPPYEVDADYSKFFPRDSKEFRAMQEIDRKQREILAEQRERSFRSEIDPFGGW